MKKNILAIIFVFFVVVVLFYTFRSELFRIYPSTELLFLSKREIKAEAIKSIKKGDEPVSAIVLHQYSIIGRGYNTIISDTNAAGHAIINAVNDAVKNMGWEKFNSLDKNSIIIMTTVEPCEFCKAFMKEYGFGRVEFLEKRPIDYWLNSYWQDLSYEFGKRKLTPTDLIDSLNLIKTEASEK